MCLVCGLSGSCSESSLIIMTEASQIHIFWILLLFPGKFNWKGTIKAVLRDAPEDGIAVKKLRKKVSWTSRHSPGQKSEVCLLVLCIVLCPSGCLLTLFFLQVLAAYYSFSGDSNFRSEEELLSLFNRKLNKNPKFRVLKDRVRLVKWRTLFCSVFIIILINGVSELMSVVS